ncbi:MAG: hypothetical protein ACOCZ5_00290 [bacterium]
MKIDIISLTGLTSTDGSIVASGATIKFETIFRAGSGNIQFILMVYRNRELFENGYRNIDVIELPTDFNKTLPDDIYYTITPFQIYEIVKDHLNNILGGEYFEIQIIEDESE